MQEWCSPTSQVRFCRYVGRVHKSHYLGRFTQPNPLLVRRLLVLARTRLPYCQCSHGAMPCLRGCRRGAKTSLPPPAAAGGLEKPIARQDLQQAAHTRALGIPREQEVCGGRGARNRHWH